MKKYFQDWGDKNINKNNQKYSANDMQNNFAIGMAIGAFAATVFWGIIAAVVL